MADGTQSQDESRGRGVDRRRRLLVRAASLAGPAVITLQSGRAWAVSNCAPEQQGFTAFRTYSRPDPIATDASTADIRNDALELTQPTDYGHSSQIEALVNLNYSC